jgi:hypothetical protein
VTSFGVEEVAAAVAERAGRAVVLGLLTRAPGLPASSLDWVLMCADDTVVPQLSEGVRELIAQLPVLGLESAGTAERYV